MNGRAVIGRPSWAAALAAGALALGAPARARAQPAPAHVERHGAADRGAAAGSEGDALRRIRELERQVAKLEAEIAALRREASRQGSDASRAVPAFASPGEAPATRASVEGSEWDVPAAGTRRDGRDDEARRRIAELETQLRKSASAAAELAEERSRRFRIEFSGKYKARFNARRNLDLDNPGQTWAYDDTSFVDQRLGLQMDATYDALLARLVLDKGNFQLDWKEDSEGTLERWGRFQTVGAQLVRELFLQYTGPFMARVGRQSWDVGHSIVLEGPMDGLRVQVPLGRLPWGTTTFSAGYMSIAGGWRSYAGFQASGGMPAGSREEVFNASNELDGYYLDVDVRPARSLRLKAYALKVVDRGGPGDADLNLDKDFDAATTPRDGEFQPLWTGLLASFALGSWKLDAEAILLSGDHSANRRVRANAALLRAAYAFGSVGPLAGFSAGLELGRGSGDATDAATGTVRSFRGLFLCRERHKFGRVFSEDLRAGYFFWDSSLSNVTYVRLTTQLEPSKGLAVRPSATRLWTTERTFAGRGPVLDWSRGASTSDRKTRDIGWEIDVEVAYALHRNLDAFFSIGSFLPGAVYARADGSSPDPAFEVVLGSEVKF